MAKHQDKILKIQALLKGYYTRVKNQAIVAKIKRDGPKKTKKYQTISKLQANIKGFLFRKRRIRALEKLNNKQNTFDDDMEDFDADNFFNIKQEHLESGLALPQEQMMQQMIQMMATQNTQVRQVPQFKKDDTNGVKFPPIRQQAQTVTSNMNDMIKPKSMIRNNRPPSARSNAISEIDMNSDSQSVKQNQPIRKNNLMQSQNDFANPNPHRLPSISGASNHNLDDSDRQSVYSMNSNPFYPTQGQNNYVQRKQEEKKQQIQKQEQVIEEWGFQNEDTKKMFEARMKKKNQGKKKVLTAEEKLQKFKAMNDQKRK